MTRQEQFKSELFALLRKYQVEMEVVVSSRSYNTSVDGISFYSFAQYDEDGECIADTIDFQVGCWEDGRD